MRRFGVVYARPWIYDGLLYALYRGDPHTRFRRVAQEIPEFSEVVDLCAGTAFFYNCLRSQDVRYQALDINPRLVNAMQAAGIDARCFDVRRDAIPSADVVIMCSSLYHFLPDAEEVIKHMISAARLKVVILEPVRNLSSSRWKALRYISRWAATIDGTVPTSHFSAEVFEKLLRSFDGLVTLETLPGGRDMLAVLDPS